jgi:hypothetical protein
MIAAELFLIASGLLVGAGIAVLAAGIVFFKWAGGTSADLIL